MKIAITGANGHVGANVVRAVITAGHEAVAIVRRNSDTRSLRGLDVDIRHADVLVPSTLLPAFSGCSHVINLAAVISISGDKSGRVMRTNVEGPRNVAAACLEAGITRLIHVSSIHAFHSNPNKAIMDESATRPKSNSFKYDRSKYLGELEVRQIIGQGLDAIILNPTGILGPHDYGTSLAGAMLKKLFSGALPILVNGGFDWVDVRDVAKVCVTALSHGKSGENYLLPGHFATFRKLDGICGEISENHVSRLFIPIWIAVLGLPFIGAWTKLSRKPQLYTWESLQTLRNASQNISAAKARQSLGYTTRPLKQSLRDCHLWYCNK